MNAQTKESFRLLLIVRRLEVRKELWPEELQALARRFHVADSPEKGGLARHRCSKSWLRFPVHRHSVLCNP